MKNYVDTCRKIDRNREKLAELQGEIKATRNGGDRKTLEERKALHETLTSPDFLKLCEEEQILRLENKILCENARHELAALVIPALVEILLKYSGKPYGEKTKQKISDEMRERTGCRVHITRSYGSAAANVWPVDIPDKIGYRGLELNAGYNTGYILDEENKIREVPADALKISYISAYVENPRAHAKKILREFAKLKTEVEIMENKVRAFSDLLPSSMDSLDLHHNWRTYLSF